MKTNKFLIILAYYERPKIVLNALNSIMELDYENFEVRFIDDGSINKGEDVVREVCSSIIDKFTFYYINNTAEDKKRQGGSIHGAYMNRAIQESDADYVIVMCDDDALFPDYLTNLDTFYNKNPDKSWCYSHVKFFNPEVETYRESVEIPLDRSFNTSSLNHYRDPISPSCRVDGSQVSFSRGAFVDNEIWYPSPQTKDCDRYIFERMIGVLGPCHFSGTYGQYKGWFINQLGAKSRLGKDDFTI
jgi:glycosyltransferase involved in cell wall biosynthesis